MTLNAYKNPIMKPIPLFLKKIPIPQLEPFLKNLPFLFMKVRGGSDYVLCLSNISSEDHKQRKTFYT